MSPSNLKLDRHGRVSLLTLNRPARKNAFDAAQYTLFREALEQVLADDEVRALVVTGAGNDFSAGADLSEGAAALETFPGFLEALSRFEKPIIAAVRGAAVGVGATMLLHCDIVYLGQSARLRFPFAALGLVPEAGSSLLLPQLIGPQRAAELLFTADWIDAEAALEFGLAARIHPDTELLEAALEKAEQIAANPTGALRAAKRLLLAPRREALEAALEREMKAMTEQAATDEAREALQAFAERHGRRNRTSEENR